MSVRVRVDRLNTLSEAKVKYISSVFRYIIAVQDVDLCLEVFVRVV